MFPKTVYEKKIYKCKFCGLEKETTKTGITNHEKHCKSNPDSIPGRKPIITDDIRKKISESLKIAHAEGRANTWKSRNKCNRSYPEKWFEAVINSEFNDKNYKTELSLGKWFLDFAWPQKKRYIEIDGSQHKRNLNRQKSDIEKDTFCKSQGWTPLRLSWSYISNNKDEAIKISKDFIDNGLIVDINWESKQEKKEKERKVLLSQGRIDKIGRVTPNVAPEEYWNNKRDLILNSGVDLMKFGWRAKVINITGLSVRAVETTIKRFNIPTFKTSRSKYCQCNSEEEYLLAK